MHRREDTGDGSWRIDQIFAPTLRHWSCAGGHELRLRPAPAGPNEHGFWVTCEVCDPPHRIKFTLSEVERLSIVRDDETEELVERARALMVRVMRAGRQGVAAGVFRDAGQF